MLDRRFIVENVELVTRNTANRGSKADVARFVALEADRKAKQTESERVESQGQRSQQIDRARRKTPAEREARKDRRPPLARAMHGRRSRAAKIAEEADAILRAIPNLTHPAAPVGADDTGESRNPPRQNAAAQVRFQAARSRRNGRKARSDRFRIGAKVAGHGFYFLKNEAVLLELAMQRTPSIC